MNVTDAASRVRGEWRHAVAMSNVDTELLSEYEQPLPIRERDGGLSCQRDADMNVTDTAARVRRERRHADMRSCDGCGVAIRMRTTATNPRT